MIRFMIGLILCMAAVGDNPEASLLASVGLAGVGLTLMYFGTKKYASSPVQRA